MHGIIGNPERVALGSALPRVERGDARKRSQHSRQGDHMQTDDKLTGLEGNSYGTRDQSGITEHRDGVVGWAGDGTPSTITGKYGCGVYTGDYPAWSRIQRLGDGGIE